MCIFCGDFISQLHWTDRTKDSGDEVIVGELQRQRQRSRLERVKFSNCILSCYQLKLRDWHGSKFLLEDLKGNSVIVHDVSTLWYEVEKLLGYPIDPLNSYLIERISSQQGLTNE